MKQAVTKLLLTSVFATVAFAQPSGSPPDPAKFVQRRVEHLTSALSLTTAQQQQATTIFTNAANASTALRDSSSAARQSLSAAVKANDATGIDLASNTIGNLTGQLTGINAKADAAFYQILTPDQQTKFNSLKGAGGPGGFGGRGGPGGPGAFSGGRR
jgi:Spy/CpxP family protein refolding chaperone